MTAGPQRKLVISILVAEICMATAGKVIFVMTPYQVPQLLGMQNIAQDLYLRQHSILVNSLSYPGHF